MFLPSPAPFLSPSRHGPAIVSENLPKQGDQDVFASGFAIPIVTIVALIFPQGNWSLPASYGQSQTGAAESVFNLQLMSEPERMAHYLKQSPARHWLTYLCGLATTIVRDLSAFPT